MGFFSIFNRKPIIKKGDIPDQRKVAEFVIWFLKNEKLVDTLLEPSNNTIFNEGYRPLYDEGNDPEKTNKITDLGGWFLCKMYIDLNILKDSSKDKWKQFIAKLDKQGMETLIKGSELAEKYHLDLGHFIYNKEIVKIPVGKDREDFKTNWLRDNVIGAEMRILAWLYLNYFNESYKIVEQTI